MMKWYNVKLDNNDSIDFRMILKEYAINYDTRQANNLTHFIIYCDTVIISEINDCLDMCRLLRK